MLGHDHERDLPHSGNDGVCLLYLFQTVAICLKHLLEPTNLPFNFPQTRQKRFPLLRAPDEMKSTIDETMFHAGVIPRGVGWARSI